MNTLITHIQLFGIGFGLGVAGPCLFVCTPIIVTYLAADRKDFFGRSKDIIIFLTGKALAYVLLGALAGLSGLLVRQFIDLGIMRFFKPVAGAISIIFGILVVSGKIGTGHKCTSASRALTSGGLFTLGFTMGMVPCPPLVALLFEITLISKGWTDGALCGLSFSLGTFAAGLIAIGAISGLITGLSAKFLRSKGANLLFRILAGALLITFGAGLIT